MPHDDTAEDPFAEFDETRPEARAQVRLSWSGSFGSARNCGLAGEPFILEPFQRRILRTTSLGRVRRW
jgi:hypothetical protein